MHVITVVPQWPYLVLVDGTLALRPVESTETEQPLGDYCGEWGSYLDEHRRPAGVRIMFFFDYVPRDLGFQHASNAEEDNGDLIVLFRDSRLPNTEGVPFLPVYLAVSSDGRAILQLSGYE